MENITIPLICTLLGAVISFLTFYKNNKKDIQSDVRDQVEMRSRLDHISKGIDDIKFNDRIRDDQLKKINERLIIAEEEIKVLFRRFERLDDRYGIRDSLERGEKDERVYKKDN